MQKSDLRLLILHKSESGYMIPCFEELRIEIFNSCNAKIFGPGYPGYDSSLGDIHKIIEYLYKDEPRPQAILAGEPAFWGLGDLLLDSFDGPKATFLEDMWTRKYPIYINFIQRNKINLVFNRYNSFGLLDRKSVTPKVEYVWSPHFAPDRFFNNCELSRKYDVVLAGALDSGLYPIRTKIAKEFKKNRFRLPFKYFCPKHPGYKYHCSNFMYVGDKYAKLLAQSKCMIVTGSSEEYALMKYFEAAASGTVILSPKFFYSKDLTDLGFIDGETMIEFWYSIEDKDFTKNIINFIQKVLSDEQKLEKIRNNARELVLKRHLIQHRAQQIVSELASRV